MKFTYKIEKHALWQAAVVALGLFAGAKAKLELGIVPFTLQTLVLCITALYFGRQANLLGTFIYMIAGLYAPVFSSNIFGKEFYYGANAGYIYSFPFAVLLISITKERYSDWLTVFAWLLMAHALVLVGGTAWGIFYIGMDYYLAFDRGFFSLLPGAIIKSFVVSVLYWILKKYPMKWEQ